MPDEVNQEFPRGVAPRTLLSQVRNTVPYLFESTGAEFDRAPYLRILREAASLS